MDKARQNNHMVLADKQTLSAVLSANPTIAEVEEHMSLHPALEHILKCVEGRLNDFKDMCLERGRHDTFLFTVDNRQMFADNVENGIWNRDQLEIAEEILLRAHGEGFIGESELEAASVSRDLRTLLTPSASGTVVMASHENIGRFSRIPSIRKQLKCTTQQATEFELYFKQVGVPVKDGIAIVKYGTEWPSKRELKFREAIEAANKAIKAAKKSGRNDLVYAWERTIDPCKRFIMSCSPVKHKFQSVEQALKYFNHLACEMNTLTPDEMKIEVEQSDGAPAVAYHAVGQPEYENIWQPPKALAKMIDRLGELDYAGIKAAGSKMRKHRFPSWEQGSIFWSEYRKAKRNADPAPHHTALYEKAMKRLGNKSIPVDIGKFRSFLFSHGPKGNGRLNEKDLNVLWKHAKTQVGASSATAAEIGKSVAQRTAADLPDVDQYIGEIAGTGAEIEKEMTI